MALTIAEVSNPNSGQSVTEFFGLKAKMIDITFDNSYLTTGEVLTAAALGWDSVQGAITVWDPALADGTLSVSTVVKPNTARTQLTFQAQETAATVDTSFKEVTSTADLSLYTGRFIILGT